MTNEAKAVAWEWKYVGSDPYPKRLGNVARAIHELDPLDNPYPDTWRPVGPLYPAATVAELRAEVSALSHELDCVNANWQASMAHAKTLRTKADAAERRVGELTSLLSDTVGNLHRMGNNEFADCDQERLDIVISRIERTLTGADPT